MDEPTFPQLAIAARRHAALLSSQTYTTERRLVFEAILRLSLDLGRHHAPLPSQRWVARITGQANTDACRAEKALLDFGMIRVRRGEDRTRLYEPEPDASRWGGKNFRWRIEEPLARARALDAEIRAATSRGPDTPGQGRLALGFVQTPQEEFTHALTQIRREHARDTAGALPPAPSSGHHQPPATDGNPSAIVEKPFDAFWRGHRRPKSRLASGGSVSHPANAPLPGPTSASAAQPPQGEQPLARRLTLPGSNLARSRDADPPPAGTSLAGQLTDGGDHSPSVPAGARDISHPANATLATRLTSASHADTGARMSGTSDIHIPHPKEIYLPSNIGEPPAAGGGKMQDAAGPAKEASGSRRAPAELLKMVFRVVRAHTPRLVRWWQQQLAAPDRQQLAVEILDDIHIRRGDTARGIGEPIENEGAWFVDQFFARSGMQRPNKGARPRTATPRS